MTIASFKKYGQYHHHRTSAHKMLLCENTTMSPGSDLLMLYHGLMVSALPKHLQKRGHTVKTNISLKLRNAGFVKANGLKLCKEYFDAAGSAVYCSAEDEYGVLKAVWVDCNDSLENCNFAYNEKTEEGKPVECGDA